MVVLNTGNPVTMSRWLGQTPALLDMWYGGQEGGHALAAVLFGDANPSGKLPVTLPKEADEHSGELSAPAAGALTPRLNHDWIDSSLIQRKFG